MVISERYEALEHIHKGRTCVVYRARDRQLDTSVILKFCRTDTSSSARLRHEYGIVKALDLPGIVRARALAEGHDGIAMVSDDLGGDTLAARLDRGPLSLPETLRIAAEIADIVAQIHQRHVIHKDINPSNILLCPDGHVRIFDFDIATRLTREVQTFQSPNLLSGTLPYISPEQTGRMNRTIDYRTDLYSFGATIYEMLTGHPPFQSRDPIELVHCHLAKTPKPPAALDHGIPAVVSELVMRLLGKTAEVRYQSAFGLRHDLEECLRRLTPEGHIEPFELAQRDVSDLFRIPEKLYGRSEEVAALEGAFERVTAGTAELVLVTGTSGIGKSSTIHALHKVLSQSRGHFIAGKFDQFQRDIPYSALLSALSGSIRSLLAEPEDELDRFRQLILGVLSGSGRVLIDVLPDLVHIIGLLPPVPELLGAASRIRFRKLVASFLQVFTRHGRPLVLFLDDLQWADAATLDLLPTLLGDSQAGALLLIGAYRDGEVSTGHPLLATLATLAETGFSRVTRVNVGPIRAAEVEQLVADTLSMNPAEAQPLSDLLWRRTGGNPFFVGELLKLLHKSGLIEFNPERRQWSFDLAQIVRAPGTENVAQVMMVRAAALRPRTQEILKLAAVLGYRFDLDTLVIVAECSPEQAEDAIDEALCEELVLAVEQLPRQVYRFLHDRIQQTIYASIPDEERVLLHHRTGELLWGSRPESEDDAWRFEVLHHLNLAAARVVVPEKRIELARLNLTAAERARASGALAAATHHYAMGIAFLPASAWTTHHETMFALHLGRAECEYLEGRHRAAEELFALLLQKAATDEESAQVYECIGLYKHHNNETKGAFEAGLQGLARLGIELDPDPSWPRVAAEYIKTRRALAGRTPRQLLEIPEATDPRTKIALRLLMSMTVAVYQLGRNVFALTTMTMVRLSVERGHTNASAVAYTAYAMLLMTSLDDYATADRFGRLALDLLERYPDKSAEAEVKMLYGWVICMWRNSARVGLQYVEEARQCGLMVGDLVNAGYGIVCVILGSWLLGQPLDAFLQVCAENSEIAHKIKANYALDILDSARQAALALQGRTLGLGSFDTSDFAELRYIARLKARESRRGMNYHYILKMRVLYILGQHEDAYACLNELVRPNKIPSLVECDLYAGLVLVARAAGKGAVERQRSLFLARRHLRKLKTWADNAPMNFRHKYLLLAAELARATGDEQTALGQYEEAIALARQNRFLHDEAVALELASHAYRARGHHEVALDHLARARMVYARWGAHAKVALLDQAHVGLAVHAESDLEPRVGPLTTSETTTSGALDVPSMIKASQALSGEISLEGLLLRITHIVAENAGAERGALVLELHGERVIVAELGPQAGARLPERPETLSESTKLSTSIVSYVFRTRERVVLSDATSDAQFSADPYIASARPKAVLCAPLVHQGVVAGVLYLENNLIPGAFTRERAELLSVLCAQMAISIDNANLYADLEQKVRERTRALEEAQARVVKLEREVTETQMAGGFAHEMRNALVGAQLMLSRVYRGSAEPLWSACQDNADTLRDLFLRVRGDLPESTQRDIVPMLKSLGKSQEAIHQVHGAVERAVTRGLALTGLILNYAELGKHEPGSDLVAVPALVQRVLDDFIDEFKEKDIAVAVSVPESSFFIGKELHYHSILKNLVVNARDALNEMNQPGDRAIRIELLDGPEGQVLAVSDTGVGISDDVREKIFDPFFTTKLATGTGLGLGVVRKLTMLYGGRIDVQSAPGQGATFRIILPKLQTSVDRLSVRGAQQSP